MKSPLYLLDAYSIIYRSYFAFIKRPLRNAEGENISALFGFFNFLFKLIDDLNPEFLAIVMDSRTPTFRHELYPEYKQNREKTPDDLHAQVPMIEKVLDALQLPCLRKDGFEADDVMATLATQCEKEKRECFIISGDKDLLQLVSDQVKILKPNGDLFETMDKAAVKEKWQITAGQVIDYLALAGDSSDNVPGVKGIGPKTAASLLQKFNNLDTIYTSLDQISSANQRKKLETAREEAFLSRQLVSLEGNINLEVRLEELQLKQVEPQTAADILKDFGAKQLAERLLKNEKSGPLKKRGSEKDILAIKNQDDLNQMTEALAQSDFLYLHCAANGPDSHLAWPAAITLYAGGNTIFFLSFSHNSWCTGKGKDVLFSFLNEILQQKNKAIIAYDLKNLYHLLRKMDITLANPYFDVMLAAWLLESGAGNYSLSFLAESWLQKKLRTEKSLIKEEGLLGDVPADKLMPYCGRCVETIQELYEKLKAELEKQKLMDLFNQMEMPLLSILAKMEEEGIYLDTEELHQYSQQLNSRLGELEDEIYQLCGEAFNINSTKQLQTILFEKRKLQPIKKTKTGFSTDSSVLEELAKQDPVPARILEHRALSKLKNTYVDALPPLVDKKKSRLHTHFIQTGTSTGRLSSKDPNLQNIPIKSEEGRRIRASFKAEKGNLLLSADYSQIELVILGHFSEDKHLLEAFQNEEDIHARTGALIFSKAPQEISTAERAIAKTINFGIMYGMGAFRLSSELGISRKGAQEFIDRYFANFQGVSRFIEKTIESAEKDGAVFTLFGRPRYIPQIKSRNKTEKKAAERIAVNSPIQGTAADIVKKAILQIDKRLQEQGSAARILLQVHDELILECPENEVKELAEIIKQEMESVVKLKIPLKVHTEYGFSWGEFH